MCVVFCGKGLLTVTNEGDIIVMGPLTGKGRSEPYVLTVRGQDQVSDGSAEVVLCRC